MAGKGGEGKRHHCQLGKEEQSSLLGGQLWVNLEIVVALTEGIHSKK